MLKWIWGAGAALSLAAFFIASGQMNHLITTYAPGLTPVTLFLDALLLPKFLMLLCGLLLNGAALAAVVGLITALVRQASVARAFELIAGLCGGAALLFGTLGGLYGYAITLKAMAATHTTSLAIVAPSHAESLLSVSFGAAAGIAGLTGALLISLLRGWRGARPAPAA